MPGYVDLENYAPPAQHSASVYAEMTRASHVRLSDGATIAPVSEGANKAAHAPHVQVMVSQIMMNAESLIASVMGVKANEVSISVNVGRFDF